MKYQGSGLLVIDMKTCQVRFIFENAYRSWGWVGMAIMENKD